MIGNYILDFYSKRYKICIEIDGDSHIVKDSYDSDRDQYLESFGVKIIRVTNDQVVDMYNSLDEYLCNRIFELINS